MRGYSKYCQFLITNFSLNSSKKKRLKMINSITLNCYSYHILIKSGHQVNLSYKKKKRYNNNNFPQEHFLVLMNFCHTDTIQTITKQKKNAQTLSNICGKKNCPRWWTLFVQLFLWQYILTFWQMNAILFSLAEKIF